MIDNKILDDILTTWAQEFISDIQRRARKIGTATGEGAASFDIDVVKTSTAGAAMVITDFADYLRHFDMKSKDRRTSNFDTAGLDRIKDWIERKGVSRFLSGYKYPTEVRRKGGTLVDVSTTRIINNIAWGISIKKKRLKRIQWYNKQKGSDTYRLYAQLVDAVVVESLKEVKESVTNKQTI